jgi:hypothetical protein
VAKASFNFGATAMGSGVRVGMGTWVLHFMQVIISAVTYSETVMLFPHWAQVTMISDMPRIVT